MRFGFDFCVEHNVKNNRETVVMSETTDSDDK